MKKAVVSGANGFLGSALCHELSEQGVLVIAIVKDADELCEEMKRI